MRSPNASVGSVYNSIMNSNPGDCPVWYPSDGNANWTYWGALSGGNDQGAVNLMAQLTTGYQNLFESTVIANIDFDKKLDFITEGLRFKALVCFKNWNRTTTNRSQGYNRYSVDNVDVDEDGNYSYELVQIGLQSKPTLSTSSSNAGVRRIKF